MQLRLLFLLTFLMAFAVTQAQHPWDRTMANTAQDLIGTLRLEKTDSVCIAPFQSETVVDSVRESAGEWFAYHIELKKPELETIYPCTGDEKVMVSGQIEPAGDNLKLAIDASNAGKNTDWSAVFYLPQTNTLPSKPDSVDVFNQFFFAVPALPAKATILRMSGIEVEGNITSVEGIEVIMEVARRNGKTKTVAIHKSEIFSINFDENEWVLYAPEELLGDDLTVEEMRVYIAGEQDARKGFKTWPTFVVGVLSCGATGFLGAGGLIVTILPPVAYTVLQLAPVIKIQAESISDERYKYNELYAMGYERVARPKKLFAGLKGGLLGTTLGTLAYFIFK